MANRLCGYEYAHVNFQPFTVNTAVMLFSIQYIYYYSAVKDCTEKPDYFASTMYTGQLYNYCTQTMIPGCVRVLYHKTEPATYGAAATSLYTVYVRLLHIYWLISGTEVEQIPLHLIKPGVACFFNADILINTWKVYTLQLISVTPPSPHCTGQLTYSLRLYIDSCCGDITATPLQTGDCNSPTPRVPIRTA